VHMVSHLGNGHAHPNKGIGWTSEWASVSRLCNNSKGHAQVWTHGCESESPLAQAPRDTLVHLVERLVYIGKRKNEGGNEGLGMLEKQDRGEIK
jgi:hypothetical protein